MSKGIDCATPLTVKTVKAIAAAGYGFAARYLVPPGYSKRLKLAEAEAITAAGMQIVSVYETTANRPNGGASAGAEDGVKAFQEAKSIGQPIGSAIYFAVDYEALSKDYDKIEAYLRAVAVVLRGYAVGVYGSYAVIEEMAKRGVAKHFWQTYAWSYGKKSVKANIYQHLNGQIVGGVTVDFNQSFGNEGWWNTKKTPKPEPNNEVKTMNEVDANMIIKKHLQPEYAAAKKNGDSKSAKEAHRLANELRKASGQPLK
ncbi:DUF1906 domain-containing protein [Cohnella silvisoli]|uniref:DUF1906 domain-containing protein n=1 Tax=Cohnella silvisoli TaxID=2873699 RepID=A0ABV1L226_9BACL|nr:DUF1906 domain-containing protein [Cohnella silvisoli]MCD9025733.1 DUF1906 domain-containing protein [Cohnella silvisoli]